MREKLFFIILGLLLYFSNNTPHYRKLQREKGGGHKSKVGYYTKKTNIMVNKR